MKTPIKVPSIGESITEVTLSSQFKPSGTFVKEGEEIGELETDKVNQVIYAPSSGTLTWTSSIGQTASINADIGYIEESSQTQPVQEEQAKADVSPAKAAPFDNSIKLQTPPQPKPVEEKKETADRKPMSPLRQTLAKKLVEAKNSTAMLTTFNEVDMSKVLSLRESHKEEFMKAHGTKLGFMAFFIKACVYALKAFPDVSYQIEGTDFIKPTSLDIGIAVSTEKGLMVPVLKHCENLKFAEIEKGVAQFAEKARSKAITLQDLKGGCFTITNGGVFGSLLSTPILNLPQSAILGMHTIQKRAVVVEDSIVIRPMMYLALSYDHRTIDGKEAVQFLVMVKKILEEHAEDLLFDRSF